jgi:hypothetical protein
VDNGCRKENASKQESGTAFRFHRNGKDSCGFALSSARRYIPRFRNGGFGRGSVTAMRAEVERLVEEIKQSVGLLRRHL